MAISQVCSPKLLPTIMSREDPLKAEKDYSATLNEQIPLIEALSDYKQAIDKYLVLEKQIRQSSDLVLSKRILTAVVDTLVANNDWTYLDELITVLSKKHGQLKTSIQTMIQRVIDHLPQLDNNIAQQLEMKIKVIETIRTVTDKKIFVEVERAKVSKILAEIYLDKKNDLDKATEILCDLQVETYSLMPFETKIEYILEQVRLTLQKKDYAQAKVLSRKILLKTLAGFDKAEEYKATYLEYLLQISRFENDYLTTVKNSLLLMEIPLVKQSPEYKTLLVSIIYYIILAPYDNLQSDLMHKIKANPVFAKNVDAQVYKLLDTFTTNELIHSENISAEYHTHFSQLLVFADNETNTKNLQKRIIEHNLRIINKYYLFIKLDRLALLLHVTLAEAETHVSELVNSGMIRAKINRPQGVIKFEKLQHGAAAGASQVTSNSENINELLNSWMYDVDKLLEEVDSIGHLINKEEMMYGLKQKA